MTIERNEVDAVAMGGTELMGAGLEKYLDKKELERWQIIRSRVRELDPDRQQILWLHDLPGDPESAHLADPASRARFKKIVMVSDWQMQQYNNFLGVPYSDCAVMRNAIEPFSADVLKKLPGEKIKIIYHPTPHRGLEILVPVFERLCEWHEDLQLDVFSSFGIYGWAERDAQYAEVIQRCKDHPNINYHGSQPNEVVRVALAEADIFAYPSIWQETSCICAIEAMSSATLVVTPNLAALPETTAGYAMMYQYNEDQQKHANTFLQVLDNAISMIRNQSTGLANHLAGTKAYADSMYSWSNRAKHWRALLGSL